MQADRTLAVLGTCLVAALAAATATSADTTGRSAGAAAGSSCAHPWQAIYRAGGPHGRFEGDKQIYMAGEIPRLIQWSVRVGYLICSARIQLANGRWVGPTSVGPYLNPDTQKRRVQGTTWAALAAAHPHCHRCQVAGAAGGELQLPGIQQPIS